MSASLTAGETGGRLPDMWKNSFPGRRQWLWQVVNDGEKSSQQGTRPLHSHLAHTHILRVVEDTNSQLSKASLGTRAAMQMLTTPVPTAESSTPRLVYVIETLNMEKFPPALLAEVTQPKELQLKSSPWPWLNSIFSSWETEYRSKMFAWDKIKILIYLTLFQSTPQHGAFIVPADTKCS